MINRENLKLSRQFLRERALYNRLSKESVRLEETWIRYLLEWADEIPFEKVHKIKPLFPEYLLSARIEGEKKQFSVNYTKKVLATARRFFLWLVTKNKSLKKQIDAEFLSILQPQRFSTENKDHEAVTIEEILGIASATTETLREKRIQAFACLLFSSGMRVGAGVTTPIRAINLQEMSIQQFPSLGVKTKFHKQETTYLLEIPELTKKITEWDNLVRNELPEASCWFAPISPKTGWFDPNICEVGEHRNSRVNKDLKDWLIKNNLPYHSPHKFRHGHDVYAIKKAKTVAELKAISQNLMHSNLSITDGIYGILSREDRKKYITGL